MRPLNCTATRRRLQSFHDGELPIPEQIAVAAHLDWCDDCAALLADFESMGTALRAAAPGRAPLPCDEAAGFTAAVVNRVKAEHDRSLAVRFRGMFEDMHLLYAGLGAATVTLASIVIVLGMVRFASGPVKLWVTPGSNERPVIMDARIMMPRALDAAFSTADETGMVDYAPSSDAVFTLAGVVTREGFVKNLELLGDNIEGAGSADDAKTIEGLLDSASRARYEPARIGGLPVAVNMVWLVAHTTVRPPAQSSLGRPATPTKKRVAVQIRTSPRTKLV